MRTFPNYFIWLFLIPVLISSGCDDTGQMGEACEIGATCDDNNSETINDIFNVDCECIGEQVSADIIVQDNVLVITDEMNNLLVAIGEEDITFKLGNNELDEIEIGAVIVSGVHSNAPKGYFRKVTAVSVSGDEVTFSTTLASFTELFKACDIDFNYQPTAEDWIKNGPLVIIINAEVHPALNIIGSVTVEPNFVWEMDIIDGFPPAVENFQVGFTSPCNSSLSAVLTPGASQLFNGDFELYEKKLKPIFFFIGPVPMVITPEVEVVLEYQLDGPSMTFDYQAGGTISSIVAYNGQEWSLESKNNYSISNASAGFNNPENLSNLLSGAVALKLEVDFEFYDLEAIEPELFVEAFGRARYGQGEDCGITPGVEIGAAIEVDFSYLVNFEQEYSVGLNYEFDHYPLLGCDTCVVDEVCDDNDACTVNDMIDEDCNCVGTFEDTDGDGICDVMDVCPNLDDNLIWTGCDDGNASTTNDIYTDNCVCEGVTTIEYELFTDPRDGEIYTILDIGNQTWFAENLNYEIENSWCYDETTVSCNTYGRLYDWEAALIGCPVGWHLPTDDEWKALELALGMNIDEVDEWANDRGTDQGDKLKEAGSTHWGGTNDGTNSSGFSALPGGTYDPWDDDFTSLGSTGAWWTATEGESPWILNGLGGWARSLKSSQSGVSRSVGNKRLAISVRCIKD